MLSLIPVVGPILAIITVTLVYPLVIQIVLVPLEFHGVITSAIANAVTIPLIVLAYAIAF
jgi:hypothetical protein